MDLKEKLEKVCEICERIRKEMLVKWVESIVYDKEEEYLEFIKNVVCGLSDEELKKFYNKYFGIIN
ncbi:MAG: hypothetical protein LWW95_08075 [Candidatus Desulfofervidus auxilii]|nr:hypothetical protein [Candidatus Desulfofervidus auxilii]